MPTPEEQEAPSSPGWSKVLQNLSPSNTVIISFAELTLKLEVSSALSCAGGQVLGCSPQPGQEHNRTTQSHPARTDADGKMPQRSEEVGDGCTFMGMGGLRESHAPWAR